MAKLELHAFSDTFLDDAARLLAARHARHRQAEPLLPDRFEDPGAARAEIEALLARDEADGVAATRDGALTGFLIGIRKEETWGPNVWVEAAGHAVERAEDARDLYAAASGRWVERGRKAHYVVVPATDPVLVEAWFRLGFGQQHAYGIRELPEVEWPDGVRPAEERDVDALMALSPELSVHQLLAPVFSGRPPTAEDPETERKELLEEMADETVASLVAEQDGRIVGNFFVCPLEVSKSMHYGLARPERMSFLGFAVTDTAVRGSGAGLALTQASFAWARSQGYEAMVTDWRVTNLLSSRFWPARGFRTTFLRLHRLIA